MTSPELAPPRLSSTILFLRDQPQGLAVLMVRRSRAVDFATNALVFPGGKVTAHDCDPALPLTLDDEPDAQTLALRVAGLREAFEESGLLRAVRAGVPIDEAGAAALDAHRGALDRGQTGLAALLAAQGLALDVRRMVRIAHWITPRMMPKRFDTHFFICPAPPGQDCRVDGHEVVEGLWLTPSEAVRLGAAGSFAIMYPTRMVLHRLERYASVAQALAEAPLLPMAPCEPMLIERDGRKGLIIADESGYPDSWEPLDSLVRAITEGRMPDPAG